MTPDENDIIFQSYGPDVSGAVQGTAGWLFGGGPGSIINSLVELFWQLWHIYSIIAFILSALIVIGLIYASIRFTQLSELETNQLLEAEQLWKQLHNDHGGHSEWESIKAHVISNNPNDWRLGIIEADIMLDKLLTERGFAGLTLGERLKSASPTSFMTLQDAWDAHLVRNKIAHEGSDFVLTQKTARDTIHRYERVFTEFGMV